MSFYLQNYPLKGLEGGEFEWQPVGIGEDVEEAEPR